MNNANPEKGELMCGFCLATAPDNSKHRGRFKRRHLIPPVTDTHFGIVTAEPVCVVYSRKQEEGRVKLAQELLQARIDTAKNAEGVNCVEDGTRVDMSGGDSLV